jgi:hypothetical protein
MKKMGAHPEGSATTWRQAAHRLKEAQEDHFQKVDCARRNISKPYVGQIRTQLLPAKK